MNSWKVSVSSLLILSLILLPGIFELNTVYAKTPTTITTTLIPPTTIKAGGSVIDKSKFGAPTTQTGTVTYTLFTGTTCSGTPPQSKIVIVTAGVIPNSPAFMINVVGSYSLTASYSGDASFLASSSLCNEFVTVNLATPTISTTLSPISPISAGGSVTDSAILTGATSTAHGTVTYQLFAGALCSGSPIDTSTNAVANDMVQPSKVFKDFNTVGTYSFQATYSGDQNNAGKIGCEAGALTVNKASPTISTTLLPPTTIIAGQSVTDSAKLAGASPTAGGPLTYALFKTTTCTGAPIATSTVTVLNGKVPNSMPFVISDLLLKPHTYSALATYTGDTNNNAITSSCESPITVNKASPTIITTLSTTFTTPATGTVTDTATLTGATANAGGTVTIDMYSGQSCATLLSFSTLSVTNGMPVSAVFGPALGAGVFSFQATYAGDNNNNMATSPCNEILTVALSPSVITTQLSFSTVAVGVAVTDQATLSGITATAAGTVNYYQYNGASCTGAAIDSELLVPVSSGGFVPVSKSFSTSAVQFYSFMATYTGDGDNAPATSSCEILTVIRASPTISTILSANPIVQGGSVTDKATLIGAASPVTGTVIFTMYTGSSCSGSVVDTSTVSVNGAGIATSGIFQGSDTATAGTFSFNAFFEGDSNNNPVTSACELLTINP